MYYRTLIPSHIRLKKQFGVTPTGGKCDSNAVFYLFIKCLVVLKERLESLEHLDLT